LHTIPIELRAKYEDVKDWLNESENNFAVISVIFSVYIRCWMIMS